MPRLSYQALPVEVRFWAKVDKSGLIVRPELGPCWIWTDPLDHGYGAFRLSRPRRRPHAHRVAWELTHGPIATDSFVCHHCDNRACVRPDHLFLGSHVANMADMRRKGREARGERHGMRRLNAALIVEMRELYAGGVVTATAIAQRFGVSIGLVSMILRGKRWSDAGGPVRPRLTWRGPERSSDGRFMAEHGDCLVTLDMPDFRALHVGSER